MEANPAAPVPNLRIVNAYARAAVNAPRPLAEPPRPIGPADADRVELAARAASASKARSLVAGSVPQPVSFQPAPKDAQQNPALPFYRHPADANAAATGVAIGRSLDVEG